MRQINSVIGIIGALCLCIGPFFSMSVSAYDPYYVSGHIRNADTGAALQTNVYLKDDRTGETISTYSDQYGAYSLNLANLPSGYQFGDRLKVWGTLANGITYWTITYLQSGTSQMTNFDLSVQPDDWGVQYYNIHPLDMVCFSRVKTQANFVWYVSGTPTYNPTIGTHNFVLFYAGWGCHDWATGLSQGDSWHVSLIYTITLYNKNNPNVPLQPSPQSKTWFYDISYGGEYHYDPVVACSLTKLQTDQQNIIVKASISCVVTDNNNNNAPVDAWTDDSTHDSIYIQWQ